jgi:hypothetical protein
MSAEEMDLPLSAVADAITRTGEVTVAPFAGEVMVTPAKEYTVVSDRKRESRTLHTFASD